jgi:hypothetical protein
MGRTGRLSIIGCMQHDMRSHNAPRLNRVGLSAAVGVTCQCVNPISTSKKGPFRKRTESSLVRRDRRDAFAQPLCKAQCRFARIGASS